MAKDKEKVLEALADINHVSQILFQFTEKARQAVVEVEDSLGYMKLLNNLDQAMGNLQEFEENL